MLKIPNIGSLDGIPGCMKTLHTLVGMGSAALAAAVVLPRLRLPKFSVRDNAPSPLKKKEKKKKKVYLVLYSHVIHPDPTIITVYVICNEIIVSVF